MSLPPPPPPPPFPSFPPPSPSLASLNIPQIHCPPPYPQISSSNPPPLTYPQPYQQPYPTHHPYPFLPPVTNNTVAPITFPLEWPATYSVTPQLPHTANKNHKMPNLQPTYPRLSLGKKSSSFRVGAKTFTLSFHGGRVRLKEEKKGFFQFLRSNYSILEVSCLTNKGGRFLEVVDYHSGAQRGNIRIPEGSRGIGWGKLATEIGSFFLGRDVKPITSPEVAPVGGAPARNVKPPYGNGFSNSYSQVIMDPEAPRPTRKFVFEWKPNSKTLWITKNMGEARKAHWATIKHKVVGLVQQPMLQKAQPEVSNPTDSSPIEHIKPTEIQASSLVVEASSLDDMDDGVDIGDPIPPHGDSELAIVALQHRASNLVSDCAQGEMGEVSEGGHEDESDNLGLSSEMVRVNLADSESELGLPVMVVECCHSEDPGCSSPLRCSPLAMMDPADCQVSIEVGAGMNSEVPSQWVKKHHRGFCRLVGFMMEEHEQQCLALLQRIEETKLESVDRRIIRRLWGNPYVDWEVLEAVGTSGGVLMLWDKRVVEQIDSFVGRFSMSCLWRGVSNGHTWVGTGLYDPTCDIARQDLWVELRDIRLRWALPWCIFGDFNVIRFPSERLRCRRLTPPMIEFSDFIEDLNLVDLPLGGDLFPDVVQNLLPRPLSDDHPIVLETGRLAGDLSQFDEKEEMGGLSSTDRDSRRAVVGELDKLAHLEETSWRQKSRVLWLKEGDNNTKFFHKMANSNRRRNHMGKVEVDGTVHDDAAEIRDKVVSFYEDLY
uniref:Endonuclease/exonuclease/phosphatase domain-containing protein n=1 Tax=Fagus sylvatica TaxID=28930 RepID=A0A2N9GDY5_FAGSY